VFERFTERAYQALVLAQDEARLLKHGYVGTEHVLLGLLRAEEGLAARVLRTLGIGLEDVRARVARVVGTGSETPSGQIPLTPRAKKAIELSLREAKALGHDYVGAEHLLLGLAREHEGVAMEILVDIGADEERIRAEVGRMLGVEVPSAGAARPWPSAPPLRWPALFAGALGVGIAIGWAIWGI
jgi:ATP-dependent Clp protease ATP-binding subunit ClpC